LDFHECFKCVLRVLISMSRYLTDPQSTLEAMLRGRVFALPGHIQAVYVQNILKLFTYILTRTEEQQDIERMNKVIMH